MWLLMSIQGSIATVASSSTKKLLKGLLKQLHQLSDVTRENVYMPQKHAAYTPKLEYYKAEKVLEPSIASQYKDP